VTLPALPPAYGATLQSLHALAEHVVAAAYFHGAQHIGLRPTPRGFGTPVFGDEERVRVDATTLVHERAGEVRRHELTTLAAAAEFVGIPLGAPPVYTAATSFSADAPLAIDRDAALALGDWYALGSAVIQDLRADHPDASAADAQIWPEHFDLACEIGDDAAGTRANYGASPGDAGIPEPYLYVGPWDPARKTGALARFAFGGACTYSELRASANAGAAARHFFTSAADQLLGA
jgi:hypothetical protein